MEDNPTYEYYGADDAAVDTGDLLAYTVETHVKLKRLEELLNQSGYDMQKYRQRVSVYLAEGRDPGDIGEPNRPSGVPNV